MPPIHKVVTGNLELYEELHDNRVKISEKMPEKL